MGRCLVDTDRRLFNIYTEGFIMLRHLLVLTGILALLAFCTGCFNKNGWQGSIAFVPINAVQDTKTLNVSKGNYESDWTTEQEGK